jgi:hypothetical protein
MVKVIGKPPISQFNKIYMIQGGLKYSLGRGTNALTAPVAGQSYFSMVGKQGTYIWTHRPTGEFSSI